MKKRYLKLFSCFLIVFFLTFTFTNEYKKAKAVEPVTTLSAILAAVAPALAPIIVLGLSTVAIGMTIKNWDIIKFTGQKIYDNLTNKGVDINTVVNGNSVTYTEDLKNSIIEETGNLPNTISQEEIISYQLNQTQMSLDAVWRTVTIQNDIATQIGLIDPSKVYKFKLSFVEPVAVYGSLKIPKINAYKTKYEGDYQVGTWNFYDEYLDDDNYIDANTMYVYMRGMQAMEMTYLSVSYPLGSPATLTKIEYIGTITNTMNFTESKANIPLTEDEKRSLLNTTVANNETVTFKEDVELLNKSVADMNAISERQIAEEETQTGILNAIKDLITSIPNSIDNVLNSVKEGFTNVISSIKNIPSEISKSFDADISTSVSSLVEGIKGKFKIDKLSGAWGALINMNTSKGEPPVIYMPLKKMVTSSTSRYQPVDAFTDETPYIDFRPFDKIEFAGMKLIDYFRMLIGFGFVYFTFNYIWNKVTPKRVIGGD